jgi:hypothetical protein
MVHSKKTAKDTKPTVAAIVRRIESLERGRSVREWIATVAIPLTALLVAVIGLITSLNARRISKDAFDLNVEPVVSVYFTPHSVPARCTLYVENRGINPVYDVRYSRNEAYIDMAKKQMVGRLMMQGSASLADVLNPNDTLRLSVPEEDLRESVRSAEISRHWAQAKGWFTPAMVFYVTYRRLPDHRLFRARRVLYPAMAQDSSIFLMTESTPAAERFGWLSNQLDSAFLSLNSDRPVW